MKDQISAFMDGEMSMENASHLLTAVNAGGDAAECWKTYHVIGDAMRGNPMFKSDLTAQIMQKIESEPTVLAPHHASTAKKTLFSKSAYLSMAASFSAVMFVGWMVMQQQQPSQVNVNSIEIAQNIPSEYLEAHQSSAPSGVAYYIQPASYTQGDK